MARSIHMQQYLICPHTLKPLRLLSEEELANLHQRVEMKGLFFQVGVPLQFLPERAYISQNQVYIYLEIEGVILLQKKTAIVAKNRTQNPNKRVTENLTEAFYKELGITPEGAFAERKFNAEEDTLPDQEQRKVLNRLLPNSGVCLVTMGTSHVDPLHNLVFNTNFEAYLHLDHNMDRLRAVVNHLKRDTQYVFCDRDALPLDDVAVNALFAYSFLDDCEKEEQKALYQSLTRVLKPKSRSVILHKGNKTSHLQNAYKADRLSKKTKSLLAPWSKKMIPEIVFHNIEQPVDVKGGAFSGKTSFGSQLSL